MKAVIIGNGDINDYSLLKEYIMIYDSIVICCDGGLRHAFKANIIPDYIMGDFDSASEELIQYYKKQNIVFKSFPKKKDKTDMEIGIDFAIEKEVEEIFVFGGMGSRFDHTLANAHILLLANRNGINAKLINENNIISVVDEEIHINGKKGDLISLIPLTTEVKGITTFNLEYELINADIKIGTSIGISNVFQRDEIIIKIKEGLLFVIQSKD